MGASTRSRSSRAQASPVARSAATAAAVTSASCGAYSGAEAGGRTQVAQPPQDLGAAVAEGAQLAAGVRRQAAARRREVAERGLARGPAVPQPEARPHAAHRLVPAQLALAGERRQQRRRVGLRDAAELEERVGRPPGRAGRSRAGRSSACTWSCLRRRRPPPRRGRRCAPPCSAASWSNAGSARRTAAAAATRCAAAASAAARRRGQRPASAGPRRPRAGAEGRTAKRRRRSRRDGATATAAAGGRRQDGRGADGAAAARRPWSPSASGEGDGSAATRMPQPASSIAAPAAASTLARHLGLTSASSMLPVFFAAASAIPPSARPLAARSRAPPAGCRLPSTRGRRRRGTTMDGSTATGHAHRTRPPATARRRRAVTPHVEDRDRHDLETCLAEIDETLADLIGRRLCATSARRRARRSRSRSRTR